MPGSTFTVSPDALRDLARGLRVASGSLNDALARGVDTSQAVFGDGHLATAVTHFSSSWQWQVDHLSTQLIDISGRLVEAADNYAQVESEQLRAEGKTGTA